MLISTNKEDRKQIMNYHRANDMLRILDFFDDLSPITTICIIFDKDDYLKNKDKITNLTHIRNGNSIKQNCMKSISIKESNNDILEVIDKIKEENKDGVLILFDLNNNPSERYERYAGISIGVSVGKAVYIDAVGYGFDGREVTKGIYSHERYNIPWMSLRRISIETLKEYRTFLINNEEYLKTREERINYLISCGYDSKKIEENIPLTYKEIPDFIWLDVIKKVLKVVYNEEDEFINSNLKEFQISGHTEEKRFRPWQLVKSNRM